MYNPLNNEIARQFFLCIENFAQTQEGQSMLNACGIEHLLVRGSSSFLLSETSQLFERPIDDIDLRVTSRRGQFNKKATFEIMPLFIARALEGSNLISNTVHNAPTSHLEKIKKRVLPKQSFTISTDESTSSEPFHPISVSIGYYFRRPDERLENFNGSTISEKNEQFICLEGIFERLTSKLMTLHNTERHALHKPGKQPLKRAFDVLDIENLYSMAKSSGYSDIEIEDRIKKGSRGWKTQYSRRQKLEEFDNLRQGYIFGEVCDTVLKEEVEAEVKTALNQLKGSKGSKLSIQEERCA